MEKAIRFLGMCILIFTVAISTISYFALTLPKERYAIRNTADTFQIIDTYTGKVMALVGDANNQKFKEHNPFNN